MLQKITRTHINRYPGIFRTIEHLVRVRQTSFMEGRRLRILSFGCSDGTEIASLRCYFPYAMIFGCDVDKDVLREAKMRLGRDSLTHLFVSTPESIKANGPYDLILGMSVFCQYPDSKKTDDLTPIYPFSLYQDLAGVLCENLYSGGILSIMNSNYLFRDLEQAKYFRTLTSPMIAGNGFVDKFNSSGKRLSTSFGNMDGYSHKREDPDLCDDDLMACLFQYMPKGEIAGLPASHEVSFNDEPHGFSDHVIDCFYYGEELNQAIQEKRAAICLQSEVLKRGDDVWLRKQWMRSSLDGAVMKLGYFWEPHEIIEASILEQRDVQAAELDSYTKKPDPLSIRIRRKLSRLIWK